MPAMITLPSASAASAVFMVVMRRPRRRAVISFSAVIFVRPIPLLWHLVMLPTENLRNELTVCCFTVASVQQIQNRNLPFLPPWTHVREYSFPGYLILRPTDNCFALIWEGWGGIFGFHKFFFAHCLCRISFLQI